MSHNVYASVFPEFEIEVEGMWFPPQKDQWDCPGGGAFAEDGQITGLFLSERNKEGKMVRVDLLTGVDRKDPAFQTIMDNLWNVIRDEAEEALALAGDSDDPQY